MPFPFISYRKGNKKFQTCNPFRDFKFTGWHPHCRCIATTILKTEEEMQADTERILNGEEPLPPSSSRNYEENLPEKFTKWLEKNETRIANAKSLPYFLADNQGLINASGGVSATPTPTTTTQTEQQAPKGVDYTQENAAIEEYVSGDGMWVNQYLRGRGDFGQLSEEEMRLIEELTDITSRETVGVQTLYRSVNADAIFGDMSDFSYEYLKEHYIYGVDNPIIMQKIQRYLDIEGKQLTEKGFMSTSRDREMVENWGDYTGSEHPVVMVIRTDGTTKGLDVERYMKLHHPEIEADDPQAEILLSRGQRYEIGKVYGKDGNIVVEVKLLPEKNAVTATVTNTTNSSTAMATSVDDALRRAKDASADFQSKTESIAKKFGATVTPVNLKSKESTERKLNEKDVAGDVNNILDLTRNTIIVRDNQDVDKIVQEIGKNFSIPVINGKIRIKDQSTSMGYTGKLVNVKLNGVIGEIQINTPQMIYAKDKSAKSILPKDVFDEIERKSGLECGLGHKYYEEWRNPETTEERRRELEELSKEYYDAIRKVKL